MKKSVELKKVTEKDLLLNMSNCDGFVYKEVYPNKDPEFEKNIVAYFSSNLRGHPTELVCCSLLYRDEKTESTISFCFDEVTLEKFKEVFSVSIDCIKNSLFNGFSIAGVTYHERQN